MDPIDGETELAVPPADAAERNPCHQDGVSGVKVHEEHHSCTENGGKKSQITNQSQPLEGDASRGVKKGRKKAPVISKHDDLDQKRNVTFLPWAESSTGIKMPLPSSSSYKNGGKHKEKSIQFRGKSTADSSDYIIKTKRFGRTTTVSGTSHKKEESVSSFGSALSSELQTKCSFCGVANAAVIVKKALLEKPLCLLHYYTTRAVRVDPNKVEVVGDGSEIQLQLQNGMQDLFAEAFTDLRKEISEESARTFQVTASDPLAILHDIGRRPKMKLKRPFVRNATSEGKKNAKEEDDEGGFVRDVTLPERFIREQRRLQQEQALMEKTRSARHMAAMMETQDNPYKRRKGTKTSYWNLAMSTNYENDKSKSRLGSESQKWEDLEKAARPSYKCSCGSTDVVSDGNIMGRTNDMAKGETWGNKDRSDVVTRCRCLTCGKAWNEEE